MKTTMATSMRRRILLQLLSVVFVCPDFAHALPDDSARAELASRLADLFGNPASAVRIGEACLAEHGAAIVLSDPTLAVTIADAFAAPARLRANIAQRIRADFAHGRMVSVGGWGLSRTEAALCSLAAITTAC